MERTAMNTMMMRMGMCMCMCFVFPCAACRM
jgi:hypothetical protein